MKTYIITLLKDNIPFKSWKQLSWDSASLYRSIRYSYSEDIEIRIGVIEGD